MKPVIPPEILTQHTGILGKTGSGKTSTGKLAVEQIVDAGGRVCILDPIKSDWWGLISSSDGKKPGLPFTILGGPRGHVPLHASAGKAIGEIVASGALPLSILDMADFGPGGLIRFFVDFAPALLRKMRGVLTLVIEEAHEFAPKERAGFENENMAVHYAKKLATSGRSKGIRLIVLTQRTQSLHNALLGSCETVITQRFSTPADQEPVIKWLKANVKDAAILEQIVDGMSSIPTGSGWICSGEAKILEFRQFPRIRTFDNSKTPTEEAAEIDVKTAPVDQEKLRAIIGDAVKEAEENDPKRLKQRVAQLERELATLQKAAPAAGASKADLDAEYARGREDGILRGRSDALTGVVKVLDDTREHLTHALANVDAVTHETGMAQLKALRTATVTPRAEYKAYGESPIAVAKRVISENHEKSSEPGGIRSSQQRILDALFTLESMGITAPTKTQLALWADVSPTSSGYFNNLGTLRSGGFISYPGPNLVQLESQGRAVATRAEDPTVEEMQEMVCMKVGTSKAAILRALIRIYPKHIRRNDLADAVGVSPTSSGYFNNLGALRSLGLVDYPSPGEVVALPVLFLEK